LLPGLSVSKREAAARRASVRDTSCNDEVGYSQIASLVFRLERIKEASSGERRVSSRRANPARLRYQGNERSDLLPLLYYAQAYIYGVGT